MHVILFRMFFPADPSHVDTTLQQVGVNYQGCPWRYAHIRQCGCHKGSTDLRICSHLYLPPPCYGGDAVAVPGPFIILLQRYPETLLSTYWDPNLECVPVSTEHESSMRACRHSSSRRFFSVGSGSKVVCNME